jgi:hypothetical protein
MLEGPTESSANMIGAEGYFDYSHLVDGAWWKFFLL